ncbi:MAG: L,D-transpeptidase [Candidatus Paceibacterota bacterium]|jgi:hypothetical protein
MSPDSKFTIERTASPILRATQVAEREEAKRREYSQEVERIEAQIKELEKEIAEIEEAPRMEESLLTDLSKREIGVVVQEMSASTPLDFESPAVKTDVEKFLKNETIKSVSGMPVPRQMDKIIRKLRRGVLMGVGILAFLPLMPKNTQEKTERDVATLSKEAPENKKQRSISPAEVDGSVLKQMSPSAQEIYLYSLTNVDSTYIIVDKPRASMYVIGKDKKLIASFPILLGAVKGEAPRTSDPDSDIPGPGATTPAGVYTIGHDVIQSDSVEYQGKVFSVYDENLKFQISIHATYPGDLEKRTRALKTPGIEDNRVSWGCINLDRENFDKYLKGNIPEDAKLFILPDDPNMTLNPKTGKLEKSNQ